VYKRQGFSGTVQNISFSFELLDKPEWSNNKTIQPQILSNGTWVDVTTYLNGTSNESSGYPFSATSSQVVVDKINPSSALVNETYRAKVTIRDGFGGVNFPDIVTYTRPVVFSNVLRPNSLLINEPVRHGSGASIRQAIGDGNFAGLRILWQATYSTSSGPNWFNLGFTSAVDGLPLIDIGGWENYKSNSSQIRCLVGFNDNDLNNGVNYSECSMVRLYDNGAPNPRSLGFEIAAPAFGQFVQLSGLGASSSQFGLSTPETFEWLYSSASTVGNWVPIGSVPWLVTPYLPDSATDGSAQDYLSGGTPMYTVAFADAYYVNIKLVVTNEFGSASSEFQFYVS
jgi:hypothetical protein